MLKEKNEWDVDFQLQRGLSQSREILRYLQVASSDSMVVAYYPAFKLNYSYHQEGVICFFTLNNASNACGRRKSYDNVKDNTTPWNKRDYWLLSI